MSTKKAAILFACVVGLTLVAFYYAIHGMSMQGVSDVIQEEK